MVITIAILVPSGETAGAAIRPEIVADFGDLAVGYIHPIQLWIAVFEARKIDFLDRLESSRGRG